MFAMYNLSAFGKQLRSIRKMMGYSQQDVSRLSGLNRDTLRRLEQGEVIPRYDTLELLSSVYKIDLLDQLKHFRSSNRLYSYYQRLDQLISNFDINILNKLTQDYTAFMENERELLLDPIIYDQFQYMLKSISNYYSNDPLKQLQSLEDFITSMRYSIPDFDAYDFKRFKYNIFEMRILLLIATSYVFHCEYDQSNLMLLFLLDTMLTDRQTNLDNILLTIKIYANLSYNYFMMDDYNKSLKFANEGISFCNNHDNMYILYLLYSRKGIAEMRLNMPYYEDSLKKSLHLLEIQNKHELYNIYCQILKDQYGLIMNTVHA